MKKIIRIGTRGSRLAIAQTELVKNELEKIFQDINITIKIIKTKGDKILDSPLSKIDDKGLFIKDLEEELINGEIDLAVHSLKDLPTELPEQLCLSAVLKRGEVRDVIISKNAGSLEEIKPGTTIATSSLRRRAQLLKYNPGLNIIDIRGNIDTRLEKMKTGYCDAIILAGAGIERLGYKREITEYISPEIILPAVCQGIIGIETRKADTAISGIVDHINNKAAFTAAAAERAFLKALEGGCQIPVGCITSVNENEFYITGAIFDLEGRKTIKKSLASNPEKSEETAVELALSILGDGGKKILDSIRTGHTGTQIINQQQQKFGKVYLIGAGPGDEGLITVKGAECLKKSEVVVYDNLVNNELLNLCTEECEKIYVGKKSNLHTLSQTEINELLVKKAESGKIVSRLKGGDPFIFGRGGEESLILAERNIDFEIIPGVTSGIAAAAYAGIPLTHRGIASNVSFITGHEMEGKQEGDINWQVLAKDKGTLVFYMGVKNLSVIAEKLIKFGKSPDTPAALIRQGTLQSQETLTGNLDNIAQKAQSANFKPPALIIVGNVVNLRGKLHWFDNGPDKKPLFGKKIIITRSRNQASELKGQLKELGADVSEFSTIKIEEVKDFRPVDKIIKQLNTFSRIIFTSANAVRIFFKRIALLNLDSRSLYGIKIVVIGKGTADCLKEYGLIPDLIPEKFTSEGITQALKELKSDYRGEKILIPGSNIARDFLPEELSNLGADVIKVDLYNTIEAEYSKETVEPVFDKFPDIVTFTSSSTVVNFVSILKKHKLNNHIEKMTGASIGPVTSRTAEDLGINVKIHAEPHTIPGLVNSILNYFKKDNYK